MEWEKLSGDAAAREAAMKAEIEKLQQFVRERDSTIKALNIDISGRDDTIAKWDKQIGELKDEIRQLEITIQQMQADIDALKQNS